MGFCLLFGSKRREGVISSQLVSSSHGALRCTFSRQCFEKEKGQGSGWFKERKGKSSVLWPRMLPYWLVNRMWTQWMWLPCTYQPKWKWNSWIKIHRESKKRNTPHGLWILSFRSEESFYGGGRTFFCREAAALSAPPRCSAHIHLCSVLKPYSCCVRLENKEKKKQNSITLPSLYFN